MVLFFVIICIFIGQFLLLGFLKNAFIYFFLGGGCSCKMCFILSRWANKSKTKTKSKVKKHPKIRQTG